MDRTHTHTSNGHRNAMNNTSPQLTPHNAHKDEYTTILLPTGTKITPSLLDYSENRITGTHQQNLKQDDHIPLIRLNVFLRAHHTKEQSQSSLTQLLIQSIKLGVFQLPQSNVMLRPHKSHYYVPTQRRKR